MKLFPEQGLTISLTPAILEILSKKEVKGNGYCTKSAKL